MAVVNGLAGRAIDVVRDFGLGFAATQTFGVSVIIWAASALGVREVWRDGGPRLARPADWLIAAIALAAALLPVGWASWVGVTIVAVWIVCDRAAPAHSTRGAWILLAVAGSQFWTKVLFAFFAPAVLAADAALTAGLLGTQRDGNLVAFLDGSGFFQIYPACSSLGNVSLAVVCWATFVNMFSGGRPGRDLLLGVLICAAVVGVNILRLVLIGSYPAYFEIIHGAVGATLVGTLTLATVVGLSMWGVQGRRPHA